MRQVRYCGMCGVYGHNQQNCPDEGAMIEREPLYLEQLIPSSLIIDYKIQSKTPLTTKPLLRMPEKPIWEVSDNEEAIRAALSENGEKHMICQQKGRMNGEEIAENKARLQKLADIYGRRLIFLRDSSKPAPLPEPTKKRGSGKAKQ